MNNYERIKSMSLEEMAEFYENIAPCDMCTCDMDNNSCMAVGCKEGIMRWLQSESEEQ